MCRAIAISLALVFPGCSAELFACERDEDCQWGAGMGLCSAGNACSFTDDACESGQRYGDHSGELSGQCVPSEGTSSGTTSVASESATSSPDATTIASLEAGNESFDPSTETGAPPESSSGEDTSSTGASRPSLLVWLQFASMDDVLVNDGELGGSASCVDKCPDVSEGAAEFNGLEECLAFANHPELVNEPFTAAAWVWPKSSQSQMTIFGKAVGAQAQNSWKLYTEAYAILQPQDFGLEMYGAPSALAEGGPVPFEQWTHVTGTWDGDTLALYLDGELAGTSATSGEAFDDHDLRFGCDEDGGVTVHTYDGWLADVRIYGGALDDAQIADLAAIVPPAPGGA